jgi:DNA-binding transcriptional LysR family regulator
MNLLKLEYFIAVAKYKSFTKGAQKSHVAQPAISQQIKSFEQDLGFELIDRSSKKFKLTDAGAALYQDGIRLLNEFTYTIDKCRDISNQLSGTLNIGITGWDENVYLIKLIEKFRKSYPNICVNFKRVSLNTIAADILNREYDCTLTVPYDFLDSESIGYLNYSRCKAYALVSKKSPLAKKESLTGEEISSQNCIIFNFKGMEKCKEHLISFFSEKGIIPSKITNVEDKDIMNIFVAMNEGIAIVPEICGVLSNLEIEKVAIEGLPQFIDLGIVYSKNSENQSLKYFLNVVLSESQNSNSDYKFSL